MTLKLGVHHWVLEYYQVSLNDEPGLTLTYFTARSNLGPYAFISEIIVIYDLKLAIDDRSDKNFLLTSKLYPLVAVCPLPRAILLTSKFCPWGYIHVLNLEKKLYKIRLQRNFLETCNKWMKWQDISVSIKTLSIGGCQPLPWGYIHV